MSKVTRNRLGNCHNKFQGDFLKVLCVCSAGLLRSPTMARVLIKNFDNVNPRAVGTTEDFALIPLDQVHLEWADLILCADVFTTAHVEDMVSKFDIGVDIVDMNIMDDFAFADPKLENMILEKLDRIRDHSADTGVFEFMRPVTSVLEV